MPRIAAITLDQLNKQFDLVDSLRQQVNQLQAQIQSHNFQIAAANPTHAPATTNNLVFTWTGSSGALSWAQGWLKDKNWNTQTINTPAPKGSAPGVQHAWAIPSGSLTVSPSTYYWLAWNSAHQQMSAQTDASLAHSNPNSHVICQIYTGTSGQSGTAGGGGSRGTSDLSGLSYKNF